MYLIINDYIEMVALIETVSCLSNAIKSPNFIIKLSVVSDSVIQYKPPTGDSDINRGFAQHR